MFVFFAFFSRLDLVVSRPGNKEMRRKPAGIAIHRANSQTSWRRHHVQAQGWVTHQAIVHLGWLIFLGAVPDDSTPSPLSQVLRKEAKHQLREQLNRLPAHYKVPLVLRYYKRMSYSDIARALNKGLPAVKMVIFRAKSRLRRNLGHFERVRRAPDLPKSSTYSSKPATVN